MDEIVITRYFSVSTAAVAGGSTFSFYIPVTTPSGYGRIGIVGFNSGSEYLSVSQVAFPNDVNVNMRGRNQANDTAGASTASVTVAFIKNGE